jgi:type IV pilus assembly protein PilN
LSELWSDEGKLKIADRKSAMKFKINLATQPYENAQRFYLLWGAVLLVVAALTGVLVYGAVLGWRNTRVLSQRVAAEQATLDKLIQQEQADLAILNKAENRDVKERSLVLNGLIHRKEFSWTLIFADLEQLMPTRLHVISIKPEIDRNYDIEIRMSVAGDSREKAIELVHNMEQSREFRHAQVRSETSTHTDAGRAQGGDTVIFEISAQYVPAAPRAPVVAQERSGR